MTDAIKFTLDGREVEARFGETIWQVGYTSNFSAGEPIAPKPSVGIHAPERIHVE